MRILFILHEPAGGGAERVAVNLMNHFAERHEVITLLLEDPALRCDYQISPKVDVRILEKANRHGHMGRTLSFIHQIRCIKREEKVDVSIGFLEQGNFLNDLSQVGELSIVSIRNLISLKALYGQYTGRRFGFAKWCDRFAKAVVCVSADVAHDQVETYGIDPSRIRVINNYCDTDYVGRMAALDTEDPVFEEFRARFGFLVVSTGRLNVQKGQWHLLRAFAKLRETHSETGLVILGEGKLRDRIAEEVHANGLEDSVYLAGRRPNPFAYMARGDAFVLTSLYEGFANAILEAMACGLPIVATDCAGVRDQLTPDRPVGERSDELILGDYGIVTPLVVDDWLGPDEPLTSEECQIHRAMCMLIEDPDLRRLYVERGRRRVLDFTPETILAQWDALIEGR